MRLINIDEEAPEEFYIFVDRSNFITAHNFRLTKKFSSGAANSCSIDSNFEKKYKEGSANYLPYKLCEIDTVSPSLYFLSAIKNYRVEYDAETYRKHNHPLYPSRLSAIYAFGSMEMCKKVSEKYHWSLDNIHKFRLRNWPLTRIAKVNMEHVSLARLAYKNSAMLEESIEYLWANYWRGSGEIVFELPSTNFERKKFNSGVIWEYLIEGVVECIE